MEGLKFVALISLMFLISCGSKDSKDKSAPIQLPQAFLSEGTHSVPCFLNRPASEGMGSSVYTIASITLASDHTGSNQFALYSDASCTSLLGSGTVAILSWENVKVGATDVLRMVQDDGSGPMEVWIPYARIGSNYYMDVDFTDGESGPYLSLPTEPQIAEFALDPASEGVLLSE